MELQDILGLKDPLIKLIDAISKGIGGISKPILVKSMANAKAHEIKTISEAIHESQKLIGEIEYKNGSISVSSKNIFDSITLPDLDIDQRIHSRLSYQENKKQINIENITQVAALDLINNPNVNEEKVDDDWISRFFKISEDISTSKMQFLWGKVLAGEVRNPSSFSLRTLDILKNISQSDAELLAGFSKYAIKSDDKVFVINPDEGNYLAEFLGFDFENYLRLRELELLFPNDLSFLIVASQEAETSLFICGSSCLSLKTPGNSSDQEITTIVYTEAGRQLLNLIDPQPADKDYLKKFASLFKGQDNTFKLAKINKIDDKSFEYTDFLNFPI